MELADLLVVTGSQNNVRAGYSSGTPQQVGQGNVVTIIDDTADLKRCCCQNCCSKHSIMQPPVPQKNSVIILRSVYEEALSALEDAGSCPERGRFGSIDQYTLGQRENVDGSFGAGH